MAEVHARLNYEAGFTPVAYPCTSATSKGGNVMCANGPVRLPVVVVGPNRAQAHLLNQNAAAGSLKSRQ